MSEFTETEQDTIQSAAFGAIALVSKAESGFFATFKESAAGSKAFAAAPPAIGEMLRSGFPKPPMGKPEEVEAKVLDGLRQSMGILSAKDAALATGFRDVITAACDAVAGAAKGVSPEEQAAITKIRAALDAGTGAAANPSTPPAPQAGTDAPLA